ncbi:MAG: type II toxin-antitoxin system HicA family toxin [Bacteroidota bacterium]
MKLPRDIGSQELIKKLSVFEYQVSRQVGSHFRLTTSKNGTHHITIPNHKPIKIGTLASILKSVSSHFQISKEEVIRRLF